MVIVLFLWFFMLGFILYAGCQNAIAERKWLALLIPAPALLLFFLVDVAFNVTVGRILFCETRNTLTFSQRLDMHLDDKGWRGELARDVGWLLDVFLPGHIHK